MIHIIGPAITVGSHRRQRCSWCGATLDDLDLATVAIAVPEGKEVDFDASVAEWPAGKLMAVSGFARFVVAHEDGDVLPADCCAMLDPEVTK